MKALQKLGAVGLVALVGCASPKTGLDTSIDYENSRTAMRTINASPVRVGEFNIRNTDFKVPGPVIFGREYTTSPLPSPGADEYDIMFTYTGKDSGSEIQLSRSDNTAEVVGEKFYIGTRARTDDGKLATRANLRMTGNYALRAKVKEYNTEGIELAKLVRTQDDFDLKIKEMELYNGDRMYLVAPKEGTNDEFCLVGTDGKVAIRADGRIGLISETMYNFSEVTREEIEARRTPPPIPRTEVEPTYDTPRIESFEAEPKIQKVEFP